jgi:hypothetical protein
LTSTRNTNPTREDDFAGMAKAQKRKGRGRGSASLSARLDTAAERQPDSEEALPEVNPPRRNSPLLAASLVFLVIWLAILAWLAATA